MSALWCDAVPCGFVMLCRGTFSSFPFLHCKVCLFVGPFVYSFVRDRSKLVRVRSVNKKSSQRNDSFANQVTRVISTKLPVRRDKVT